MEKHTLTSIVVPVYNDEDTIEISLRTLIKQTYFAKEIIVIDDGSTDETPKVLSRMAEMYPIRVFYREHKGITASRNNGFKLAEGEIVFFAEADAIYDKDYLKKAVEVLSSSSELGGVCLTGAPWITKSTFVTRCIDVENRIQRKLLREGKMAPFYSWVFTKKALEKVGGFDERLFQGEDKDVFRRIKKEGYSIGLVTGINWRHKRDQRLWEFLKRSYGGAKTRIIFLMKHHKIREFVRAVGLLWFIVVLGFFGVAWSHVFYYIAVLSICVALIYKIISVSRLGWGCVKDKKIFFFLPFFSLLRYLSNAIGYTHSLLTVLRWKFEKKPIEWLSVR